MADHHRVIQFREISNPVLPPLPQRGVWDAHMARITNNLSGTAGFMPSRLVYQGPKGILEYIVRNDNTKYEALLNRNRFATAPHQSIGQVRPTKDWWESQPRQRLGLSPSDPTPPQQKF